MKFNLQYFAEQPPKPSNPPKPGNGSEKPASSNKPSNSGTHKPKVKTYTQAEVDKIAKESVQDQLKKWQDSHADDITNAKAEQKKLDNMNQTELKAHLKKVQQAKWDKVLAENKQYKHQATVNKAMKDTTNLLAKAKIPNSDKAVNFVFDVDPEKRQKNVDALKSYLSDYADNVKTEALKGKHEPQTGNGTTGLVNTHTKNGKLEDPFVHALKEQKKGDL